MNTISNRYTASAILFACISSAPVLAATDLNVTWLDNSDNENGFIIEKTLMSNPNYEKIADLPKNTTDYQDFQVVSGETYCYRVSAYNSAGIAQSSEKCLKVEDSSPIEVTPGEVSISSSFIDKPLNTDIGGKEFYSFKSETHFNEEYSNESIGNVIFTSNDGSVSYRDSDITFTDHGNEIENGYAGISFNKENNLEFDLNGTGSNQSATLYMKIGAWSNDASGVVVTIGNTVHNVVIPKGYTWHYVAINIAYTETVTVNIATSVSVGGYSSVQFNGLVLNEMAPLSVENIASLSDVNLNAETDIDVTDIEYLSANEVPGNEQVSKAEVVSIDYFGATQYRNRSFNFIDNDEIMASGYQGMSWSEKNGVAVQLQADGENERVASFYIKAGAWTNDNAQISVSINGVEELIELPGTRSWYNIKVDVNFTGTAEVIIKPSGQFASYSHVGFAGVLIN